MNDLLGMMTNVVIGVVEEAGKKINESVEKFKGEYERLAEQGAKSQDPAAVQMREFSERFINELQSIQSRMDELLSNLPGSKK